MGRVGKVSRKNGIDVVGNMIFLIFHQRYNLEYNDLGNLS